MPEGTSPINPTDLNTLNSSAPSPSMIAAAPKPPQPPRNLLPLVIILAIISCAGLGASIFFGVQNIAKDSEISDLKSQLGLTPDQPSSPSTPTTPSNSTPDKSQILAEVPASLILANADCLNSDMYDSNYNFETHSTGLSTGERYFYTVSYNAATSTPSLYINWDYIITQENPLYGLTTDKTGEETITDFGLSGKAADVIFAQLSYQATGYEYILFLMEDGTVEYLPLMQALRENNFKSHGKLEGITNVIKFYAGTATPTNAPIGFGPDILAQRADGNYYSLITAIQATGEY